MFWYPFLRPYNQNKIDLRSLPCVFIACSTNHKGYLCYHSPSSRIYIARHVVFNEDIFPFSTKLPPPPVSSSDPLNLTSTILLEQVAIILPPASSSSTQSSHSTPPSSHFVQQSPHTSSFSTNHKPKLSTIYSQFSSKTNSF